ncbi:uncharacterized protein NPIL_204311 [Nephila pilipes]|uniref:Uncharacterized protein n=1 Tax=Nephila pilipes TaxID=299642 RepID=A0A8X6P744_NEPPI|nr:uncharacterized protein NPIL_204311 [Nephila pilipes]
MKTIDELFEFIFENDKTVVYGNLGRQPHVLFEYLIRNYPTFEIHVFSDYYHLPSASNIQVNRDFYGKCDLLIFIEPPPNMIVSPPKEAARIVVFTSHLLLTEMSSPSVYVSFFNVPNIRNEILNVKSVLSLQENSVQAMRGDVLKNQINYFNVKTIGVNFPVCDINIVPGKPTNPLEYKTFVIADLTNTTSPLNLLVYLWDIFDYLKDNIDKIERWLICFPEKRIKRYEQFVQECINKLFCKTFMHGNVINSAELLGLTPFYKSGVFDKSHSCENKYFCRLKYVAPTNETEAFKTCIAHNLNPLNGQLYLVE